MRENNGTPRPVRRRKRGRRLFIAYAIQAMLALLAATMAVLVVCGALYVRDLLRPPPEDGQGAQDGQGTQDGQEPGTPGIGGVIQLPQTQQPEKLAGLVVIDPGHGGVQPGCAFDGVLEKDITLPIALLAAEKLRARGVTVILTRETDEDVSLEDRCRIANQAGADLFVSIHCNSYEQDPSVSGFEGYYHESDEGRRLAELIMSAAKALSVKTRHVRDENYQVLRDTDMPSALMEVGFMSSPDECSRLGTPEYQDTIAQAVADGVIGMLTG